MEFQGKRILLIAPMFFGYEKEIKLKLEEEGAIVDYYNDKPDNGFITKSLIRIDRRLLKRKTDSYYQNIIDETKNNIYDYILFIRGESVSKTILKKLRETQASSVFILYLWDSIYYNPNVKNIAMEFDKVLSFDRSDCESYTQFEFLPLFYTKDFEKAAQSTITPKYDACFIGTVHTDRYKILEKLIADLNAQNRKIYVFCYYPSKLLFFIRSFFNPGFYRFGKRHISFTGLKLTEVVEIFSQSISVVDINRPDQKGLTMRSIEVLGARKKLITTNSDIVNYDIYNPSTTRIIDREKPEISTDFFDQDSTTDFDPEVLRKYSITNWLNTVFTVSSS